MADSAQMNGPESDGAHPALTVLVEVWDHQRSNLYRLCLRWVGGCPEDAEDALSQLSIRALESLPEEAGTISNYSAWLTRLAHNLCMDMHRERSSRARALRHLADKQPALDVPTEAQPDAEQLRRELGEQLCSAIAMLPPRLREPCRRRFIEEMAYEDIARELDLTNETVRKRIQEARSLLGQHLDGYLHDGVALPRR